jgi:hypothetical protein
MKFGQQLQTGIRGPFRRWVWRQSSGFRLTNPGYHPIQIDRVVVQPVANLDLALGGGEAINVGAAKVMTDRRRCIDDAGDGTGRPDELKGFDVIETCIEQHAVSH